VWAQWCPTYTVFCYSFDLFRLVYPKMSTSLDCHFWIALWYSLTFSYRRLIFFPNCIWTPTFSAKHNNLASVVCHTSQMFLSHFNTVTTNFNGEGGNLSLQILTTGKIGTKHSLCEIDVNITNGGIFFTHHEQYYIDIYVQI
jgi:hypothetical protein